MNFVNFIFVASFASHILLAGVATQLSRYKLIGGTRVSTSNYKYVVAVYVRNEEGTFTVCGGGIIDNRFVITAAHCLYHNYKIVKGPIVIVAGTVDLKNYSDPNRRSVEVEKVYVPVRDPVEETSKDIAVLKLRTSLDVENNESLQKLRLPNSHLAENLDNDYARVAGFGIDNLQYAFNKTNNQYEVLSKSTSKNLNSGIVRILSNNECKKYKNKHIDDSKLCARMMPARPNQQNKYGLCRGDSGSPLVYHSDILVGIESATGLVCDDSLSPATYTRVAYYINFIENAMNDVTDNMYFQDIKSARA